MAEADFHVAGIRAAHRIKTSPAIRTQEKREDLFGSRQDEDAGIQGKAGPIHAVTSTTYFSRGISVTDCRERTD